MLRISRANPTGACEVLTLEGRLVGPWVAECSRHASASLSASTRVVIDLSGITFADRHGVRLLTALAARAELQGGSGFINNLLNGEAMTALDNSAAGVARIAPVNAALQTPPAGEEDLLARLRAGDDEAFEELVRTHAGRLLVVARRYLRDDEARDAVQDAFLCAFRALPSFAGHSRLGTWLHRIVVNAALMRLRRARRRPEASIEDLLPRFLEDGHHAEQFGEWLPADVLMEREEARAAVRAAIDGLPATYRAVLLLRDIEELETCEIARLLGITPNAVKIRAHRARQALRTLLDPIMRPHAAGHAS